MRRVLRIAWTGATALSLSLFAVACAGWARGYRAVDELQAGLLDCSAAVETYNGRLKLMVRVPLGGPAPTVPYSQVSRERGVVPGWPEDCEQPMGPLGSIYLWRQRWPLATTNYGRDVPTALFWSPAARAGISHNSMAGLPPWSDRYLAVRLPHWLAAASFGLLPGVRALGWYRRRRRRATPAFEVVRKVGDA